MRIELKRRASPYSTYDCLALSLDEAVRDVLRDMDEAYKLMPNVIDKMIEEGEPADVGYAVASWITRGSKRQLVREIADEIRRLNKNHANGAQTLRVAYALWVEARRGSKQ